MKKLLALTLTFCLSGEAFAGANGNIKRVENLLHKRLPKLQFQKIVPAPVKGLYEIQAGTNVIYTDEDVDHIIFGAIYNLEGRNLTTEERRELFKQFALKLAKTFPNGIHVEGKEKPVLYVVVDTDCPFSRQVLKDLFSKDVDFYAVFLTGHRESFPHTAYVLNSRDKKKALKEVVSGKLDGKGQDLLKSISAEKRKEYSSRIRKWEKWSENNGINGVPFIIVPAKQAVIQGARLGLINRLYPIGFSQIKLSKSAVVVGSGKGKKVVVVTDPTCPFCRMACNTLRHYAKEGKVTYYVYFLPTHGNYSMKYIADIMNTPKSKRPELLKEFFEGKRKASGKPFSPEAEREFNENLKVVNKIGVTATPTFIFQNGKSVAGANLPELKKLIGGEK